VFQAVETVKQLVEPWSLEQQHSIEVLVEDITLASASIAALTKQKGMYFHVLIIDQIHFIKFNLFYWPASSSPQVRHEDVFCRRSCSLEQMPCEHKTLHSSPLFKQALSFYL
jgi:hypothetical protein